MKRFILAAVAALSLLAAAKSEAVTIASREVGWVTTTSASPSPFPTFTSRKGFNGYAADTTQSFSLQGAALPTAALASGSGVDSVTVAYVQFFSDSSVAVTNTLSSVSYVIEGSGDAVTWSAIATVASNAIASSGDTFFQIPLGINSGIGAVGGNGKKASPLLAPFLRIRFTACTGNFYAGRCRLVYLAN